MSASSSKPKRDRRCFSKLRLSLLLICLVIVANLVFTSRKRIAAYVGIEDAIGESSVTKGSGVGVPTRAAIKKFFNEEFNKPTNIQSTAALPSIDEILSHQLNQELARPLIRPKMSLVKLSENSDGPISLHVDGPEDAVDERQLLQLAPPLLKGNNDVLVVDVPSKVRARHKEKYLRLANEEDKMESKLKVLHRVLDASTERIEKRFRFILLVIAVRTRRILDVVQVVEEWQRQCDDVTGRSSHARSHPLSICLTVLAFPSEFSNTSVAHYESLLRDDTVMVVHTPVALAQGIVKLQIAGFEHSMFRFSQKLRRGVEIDYVLLTAVQFVPTRRDKHAMPFITELVRQYEDASDVMDVLSRRVVGGASRRGPVLGCTLVIDQQISGGDFQYGGDQLVVDHGVEFLYGNGDGGNLLNSLYAVRRHAGLTTRDERTNGKFRGSLFKPQWNNRTLNISQLPGGVESVHAVSPYCAFLAARMLSKFATQVATKSFPFSIDGSFVVQSLIEDFEEAVGTGPHKSRLENRTVIGHFVQLNNEFQEEYFAADAAETKQHLFDIAASRLQRLDKIRSTIRFADVMSGSAQFKRTVSFFIRFLDESIRFFDSLSSTAFSALPKDRSIILNRLPKFVRNVEKQHDDIVNSHAATEDRLAAALLYASRGLDALGRWYRQNKAKTKKLSTELILQEESVMWDLCLRARSNQIPTVISNASVRFQQHEYLEGASLVATEFTLKRSPVYTAYAERSILPVSTRLSGPFQKEWEGPLIDLGVHPSFSQKPRMQIVWYTHCCHCCGFSNELQSLVYPLQHYVNVHLTAGPECFCDNASRTLHDTLERLYVRPQNVQRYASDDVVVYISHTNPTLFHLSQEVVHAKHDYLVGRSMYEFSRINAEHIELANKLADEVWVPTQFVYHSYLTSGAKREKLVIIPEAIDTHLFDPDTAERFDLPPKKLFHMCNRDLSQKRAATMFKFLSDFKWEPRKGWDVLFEAYFRAFDSSDNVVLFVLTHIWFPGGPETYGWANNITWIMGDLNKYLHEKTSLFQSGISEEKLPTYCIISQSIPVTTMAALYNSVDAFVYTTRGEGWGLPAMQAMSMGLPVIATNFGGVTEFLKPFNSFLIPLDGVVEIPFDSVYGWSFGTKWASPSVLHAGRLMRYVADHGEHARRVGRVARQYIVENFSEEALGRILADRLERIRKKVLSSRIENEMRKQLKP